MQLDKSGGMESTSAQELPRRAVFNYIVHGPPISPQQESDLLQQLECVLKQAQRFAKTLELEPLDLNDLMAVPKMPIIVENASSDPTYPDPLADVLNDYNFMHIPSFMTSHKSPLKKSESHQLSEEEEEKKQLLDVTHSLTAVVKRTVAVCVQYNHMSDSFAKRALWLVECLDSIIDSLLQSQRHNFSLSGLAAKLLLPGWVSSPQGELKYYINSMLWIVTVADCVLDNVATNPVQYRNIGKECSIILAGDYCFKKHQISSDSANMESLAFGAQMEHGDSSGRLMMDVKGINKSLFILVKTLDTQNAVANAANPSNGAGHIENDIASAKFSVDKLFGRSLKSAIECPYPSLNTKCLIEGVHPYCVYGCGFGLHRAYGGIAPDTQLQRYTTLHFSGLFGVKSFGFGGEATIDSETNQVRCALGLDMRSKLCAIGVTMKQDVPFRATVCKKLVDSSTTVAGEIKYSREAGLEKGFNLTLGLKHSFDPDLYLKARAGTGGIGVAVKKSWNEGKCSLKAAAHININSEWRQPRLGVEFSFGQ